MNSQALGIVLAVVSAVSLGISTSLYKQSSEVLTPMQTTLYYYLFSALLAAIVWCFYGESKPVITANLIWPAGIAVFLFISVLSFNFALIHLSISVAATIRALSFVVTVMIGVFWYRDQLTWQHGLAVFLSLLAVFLAGMGNTNTD